MDSKLISRQVGGTDAVYQCPYCTKAPKGFDDLKLHMTLAHNTKKILSCSHCNYQTLIEQNLISRKSEKHPDISKVSCPSCNYQTFGKVGLSQSKKEMFGVSTSDYHNGSPGLNGPPLGQDDTQRIPFNLFSTTHNPNPFTSTKSQSKNMNIANLSNDLPSSNINEPVDKLKVAPRIDMKPSSIKSVPQKQIGPEVQANLLITIHVFSCISCILIF